MKIKIKVPTSLSDIKLSQYQKFIKTTKDSEDEDWIAKQLVGIFCNVPDEIVRKIPKKDFNDIIQTISSIINEKSEFKPIIHYNGVDYGFIPNLEEITVGEQSDIDSMINEWSKMDRVMGVLYRPVVAERKGKYIIQEYEGGASLDLTMDVVNSSMSFFLNLLNDLLSYTQSYMREEVSKIKQSQISGLNGDGIKTFTDSLEEIFLNLKMSLN